MVQDMLTGLWWTRNANPNDFPMTWPEALDYIRSFSEEQAGGFSDWRLPNRRELRSLVSHQARNPALPEGHPFKNIFMGWYWTATTAAIAPNHAWYIHMEGARMFYGGKDQSYMAWPVRGGSEVLPRTGQQRCHDRDGNDLSCAGTGQDGEYQLGQPWPQPRFVEQNPGILDRLTGLLWGRRAGVTDTPVDWQTALDMVNGITLGGIEWRLPNINELESLVDCSRCDPALPDGHPFEDVRDGYWSSTTSAFEPDWAFALYSNKGAVGVGQKKDPHFFVWPVADVTAPIDLQITAGCA